MGVSREMVKSLVVEILDFFSLREVKEDLEERIAQFCLMKEEYSEELGAYLRSAEEKYGKETWFKNIFLKKLKGYEREAKKRRKKENKKKKDKTASSCWISYKGLNISSSDQGEFEMLFEAIEELGKKVDKLIKTKTVVEELMKVGIGENLKYRVYIKEGVPQKIILKPREKDAERFTLNMVFSTIN
jgi:hypothetical protein